MHDIGKVIVPTEILKKPGKLTEEEYMVIKNHPEEGFELLRKTQNGSTSSCSLCFPAS